ncbi:MAG TPA: hypothetical protein VF240_13105 [Pyrinomonadaceae bacterium]
MNGKLRWPALTRISLAACACLLWTVAAAGQPPPCTSANTVPVTIELAQALLDRDGSGRRILSVTFSESFDLSLPTNTPLDPLNVDPVVRANLNLDLERNPVKDPSNYHLLDVRNSRRIPIVYVYFRTDRLTPNAVTLTVDPSVRLDEGDGVYHLYAFNLRFISTSGSTITNSGLCPAKQLQRPVSVEAAVQPAPPPTGKADDSESGEGLSLTAADGREDANFYVSGEVTRPSGESFFGTVDVLIDYPVKKVIENRVHSYGPFFELKASSDPGADPDSLNFGFNSRFPLWRYRGPNQSVPFRRLILKNSPKIEAERDFGNVNFVHETRFTLLSKTFLSGSTTFYLRPFAGLEIGKNFVSPLDEAEGRFLIRPLAGSTLNIIFPMARGPIQSIGLEASYIRRWPLRKEIKFEEDDDGELQPVEIGTGPRDYATAKLNFDFSKLYNAFIGYEYGSVPPSFKLVDHKMVIGLTFKAKR